MNENNNASSLFKGTMYCIGIMIILLLLMRTELVVFVMIPVMLLILPTYILGLVVIIKSLINKEYDRTFIVFISMTILSILVYLISKVEYNFHA
jgi:hypothetical protein